MQDILNDLKKLADPERAKNLQRFFKTGKGQYGEGDIFWGITVPNIRKIAKEYYNLKIEDIGVLIQNPVHEIRMTALLILVQIAKTNPLAAYNLYLANTKYINNWDLIDLTAEHVIGAYLDSNDKSILTKLALSKSLWERRIAIMATFHFIKKKQPACTMQLAEIMVNDKHDLIQKAVGWMLREVGKRCSQKIEEKFLVKYAKTMPRTMLRYAIERFPENKRKYYLNLYK